MSFILDAIAKSERERQQQEIPDASILAIPVSNTRQPRKIIPYLVVGVLLVNVIVLLTWVQTENSTLEPFATNDSTMPEKNVGTVNKTATIEHSDSAGPAQQAVEFDREVFQTARAKPSMTIVVPQAENTVVADDASVEINSRTSTPFEDARAGAKVDSGSTLSNKTPGNWVGKSNTVIEAGIQSDVIGGASLGYQTGIRNTVETSPREVSRLVDLPADVRRDLPSVAFSGHLFSKNVNVSYVMVDGGRSVTAGQQIVDDVFLHEVTPTGAIVDFRGYLIEIGILQNWSLK